MPLRDRRRRDGNDPARAIADHRSRRVACCVFDPCRARIVEILVGTPSERASASGARCRRPARACGRRSRARCARRGRPRAGRGARAAGSAIRDLERDARGEERVDQRVSCSSVQSMSTSSVAKREARRAWDARGCRPASRARAPRASDVRVHVRVDGQIRRAAARENAWTIVPFGRRTAWSEPTRWVKRRTSRAAARARARRASRTRRRAARRTARARRGSRGLRRRCRSLRLTSREMWSVTRRAGRPTRRRARPPERW